MDVWQSIPFRVISASERLHYDGLTNDIFRSWAKDSFKMRGVTWDGKAWVYTKERDVSSAKS
jgi:hypothetical protein